MKLPGFSIGGIFGLPSGCEFGVCGGITDSFQAGAATAPGSWCLQHPKVCTPGIEIADVLEKIPPIAASVLLLNMQGDNSRPKPTDAGCRVIVQKAKNTCTNQIPFDGQRGNQLGAWRRCVTADRGANGV